MRDVLDRRCRGDEREPELALEALADDVHVQQPQEPAAEAETQRRARLGFVGHAGVVQLQLLERVAQVRELVAVDRVDAAEDHRLRVLVALDGPGGRARGLGHRLADTGFPDVLDAGDEVADLARAERLDRDLRRRADADLFDFVGGPGLQEAQLLPRRQGPVHHPHGAHDAPVLVVIGVEQQRTQAVGRIPLRGGDAPDDLVEELCDPFAGLGGYAQDLVGGEPEHALDLLRVAVRVGRRQVDLVECGDDLEVVLEGEITVRERLGLYSLRGVDEEHHALAGCQAAGDLIAEVDMAGRVDQLEHVVPPPDTHVLRLDGDAAFALEVHRVEVLGTHLAGIDREGQLEDAVRQGRLPMVDMADDGEIADDLRGDHGIHRATSTTVCPRCRLAGTLVAPRGFSASVLRAEGRMANIKSQIKRNRQNERRRVSNKSVRSELKTRTKNALYAAENGAEDSAEQLRQAVKRIDKAAAKGVIHANQASRRKSRLVRRIAAVTPDYPEES